MLPLTLVFLLTVQAPLPSVAPPPPTRLPWQYAEDFTKDLKAQQIRMCPPAREGADPEMVLILLLETGNRKFLYWGMENRWVIGEFPVAEPGQAPSWLWMGTVNPENKALVIVRGPEPFSRETYEGQPCAWLLTP